MSGLYDYVAENPYTGQPTAARPPERDFRADEEAARKLQGQITEKVRQGAPPQNILYDCLSLIGILGQDEEWTGELKAHLSEVYEGLEDPVLFNDIGIEAARLNQQQEAYKEKALRTLRRNLSACKSLELELSKAISAAEGLTEKEEDDGDEIPM